jgi:MFS transporter, FSR family, fosmidomycin resistance protein
VARRAPVSALATVLVVRLADETGAFLPSGTLESFRADLGLTYAQAGTVLAAIWPGALVGGVFAAASDRCSRRVIAAAGALGYAASLALFAMGGSFAALVMAAFVLGMASTAMVDAAEVALVDLAGDDLRRSLARSNLLATFGDLLGPALVAAVAVAGLSWRMAFAGGAVLLAVYGVALAAAPLPPPGRAGAGGDGEDRPGLGSVLRDPAVWMVGVIGLLMNPFDEPLVGFTIALLEQERGASTAAATVVAFVGLSGGVLAFTVLARRLGGVPDDRLLAGSVAAMTVAALVIAFAPVLPVVALAALVASVGLSLAWLAVQHRSLTLRPGQVGTTKAVLGTIESTGFWIPVAVGALADAAGLTAALGSYGVLGAVMVVLAVWSGRRTPPTGSPSTGPLSD